MRENTHKNSYLISRNSSLVVKIRRSLFQCIVWVHTTPQKKTNEKEILGDI